MSMRNLPRELRVIAVGGSVAATQSSVFGQQPLLCRTNGSSFSSSLTLQRENCRRDVNFVSAVCYGVIMFDTRLYNDRLGHMNWVQISTLNCNGGCKHFAKCIEKTYICIAVP